jgi:threonine/homoserine/homoserine lactone efflux protein
MNVLYAFLFGFLSSGFGIALPGLINMTAAKISIKEGKERALVFVMGAIGVILLQTAMAIIFANFIDENPSFVILLREIGFVLFLIISIYFLIIAKKPQIDAEKIKRRSKKSRFFLGMLLAVVNFFPIPYYVFVTVTLSTYRLFSFKTIEISAFLFAVVLGSFAAFYYYISFFSKPDAKSNFFFKNSNKIIGVITAIVAIIALIKIIPFYF